MTAAAKSYDGIVIGAGHHGLILATYMARHVHDAHDHDAYLEAVGIRRLTSLLV